MCPICPIDAAPGVDEIGLLRVDKVTNLTAGECSRFKAEVAPNVRPLV